MGLFKKKIVKKTYDREHMKPVIRASICTGEEVEKEYVDVWYTRFAAGAVLISIPIAALFMIMQRCYNESMTGAVKG